MSNGEDYFGTIGISNFRTDYYDSSLYAANLMCTVEEVIRYSVIKQQLEAEGEYDPNKIIYIGEYANRKSDTQYTGPRVGYYLKDLIAWGQYGVTQSGIAHSYKTFDSWEDMYSFFGRNGEDETADIDINIPAESMEENEENAEGEAYGGSSSLYDQYNYSYSTYDYDENSEDLEIYISDGDNTYSLNSVPMLDVISNRYLTVDGHTLEYYAYGESDYKNLVNCLETTASSLYINYTEYVKFNEMYNPDNTNIRFYISDGTNIYTNDFDSRFYDDNQLVDSYRKMGEYIHAMPSQYEYLTNTPLDFDEISSAMYAYSYAFNDQSFIWVGLDTTYPVDDLFASNYYGIKRTIALIPWIISFAAIGVLGFVTLLIYIISTGKKRLSFEGAGNELVFMDKWPLELELLVAGVLALLYYFIAVILFGNKSVYTAKKLSELLTPTILISFLAVFTCLLFLYSLLRRLITKTLLKRSFISTFIKWIYKKSTFIQKVTGGVYSSVGMAARTWAEYIFFLIFNTFWACMLFFSSIPALSFFILVIFDGFTGIILFNRNAEKRRIIEGIMNITQGDFDYQLPMDQFHGSNRELASAVNDIGEAMNKAVETSSRDERLKADLITNVSHDIKTPLTSIINYVDLIKRENIDNDRVKNYIRILDEKSQRLKQLTLDLVEASKITSGNITLEISRINLLELLNQAKGEFEDKYQEKGLTLVDSKPDTPVVIDADARYVWRIIENLFQNVYKYAMEGTRVYLDVSMVNATQSVVIAVKNISKQQLNINADELTERFIRGDLARSTEGSGLGLSIVKSLVKAHNGTFDVYLDGDLFKATVTLPITQQSV